MWGIVTQRWHLHLVNARSMKFRDNAGAQRPPTMIWIFHLLMMIVTKVQIQRGRWTVVADLLRSILYPNGNTAALDSCMCHTQRRSELELVWKSLDAAVVPGGQVDARLLFGVPFLRDNRQYRR